MALNDLFAFLHPHEAATDPVARRAPVIEGLDATQAQFERGDAGDDDRWWREDNGVVAFSAMLHGTPLVINGQTTNFIDAERFPAFLRQFRVELDAGGFDDMIAAIERGTGNAGSTVALPT